MSERSNIGFAALWTELEASAVNEGAGWWLIRCRATPGRSLLAGREPGTGRRAILLPLDDAEAPSAKQWPRLTTLSPISVVIDRAPHIGVVLVESRFVDVFDALAVDLARRVEEAADSHTAVAALLGQLHRWHRFLATKSQGLDLPAQRGLWGELHFLEFGLVPAVGAADAVAAWTGPRRGHQDFQVTTAWVEVKTTLAEQPQAVRISSERQLDDTHAPVLFLHVLSLEQNDAGHDTLPHRVATLRAALSSAPIARENFEDGLLAAGYLDRDAARYDTPGYTVRQVKTYRVAKGFPRVVESQLPTGVGGVSYDLALAACEPFSISPETFKTGLATSGTVAAH